MKIVIIMTIFTLGAFFLVLGCSKQKSSTTQVTFFLKQDCGVGPVTMSCNGSSQAITLFFAYGNPSCGQTGTATFTLPGGGNYVVTGKGGNITWSATVSITAGQCNEYSLDCSGNTSSSGGGGGNGSTYYYANWNCNGSAGCATVMGGTKGSDGPFCTNTDCQAWGNKFIPGGYSCATSPNTSPVLGGTPPNGKCFQIGDF